MAGRTSDFEEIIPSLQVGSDDCKRDFKNLRDTAVARVEDFRKWVEKWQKKLNDYGVENLDVNKLIAAIDSIPKESCSEYKQELSDTRKAITAVRTFIAGVLKSVNKTTTPRAKQRPTAVTSAALAKLLVTANADAPSYEDLNLCKEAASFLKKPVALSGEKIENFYSLVTEHRVMQALMKNNRKAQIRSKLTYQKAPVGQQKAVTDMKRMINQNCGCGELLLAKISSDESVAYRAFEFEFFRYTNLYNGVGLAQYGLPEARMVVSGQMVVIGINAEATKGETLKEKYSDIYNMHIRDLLNLAKQSGFVHVANGDEENTLVLIPHGFIVIELVTSEVVEGLRWSFATSEEHQSKLVELQEPIVQSYPEANSVIMQALHRLCG